MKTHKRTSMLPVLAVALLALWVGTAFTFKKESSKKPGLYQRLSGQVGHTLNEGIRDIYSAR